MSEPEAITKKLREVLDKEQGRADRLERSLVKAREWAGAELDPDLYAALDWPRDLGEHEAYLKRFVRWVPHESDADAWPQEGKEEFGYFQFGGSDIIILFQEGVDPELDKSEEFQLVGTPVARCRAPRGV